MGWFSSFIYFQLFVTLPKPTKDFTDQTIIISGSNTGLGLEAARHISRLNASLLVLAVRDVSKGAAAKQSILESNNTHRVSRCGI
jgi:NAD(P)-dependent dehydrogenase (short-subunit alcohol dehydrogenase family)